MEEELLALCSIYCAPGELEIQCGDIVISDVANIHLLRHESQYPVYIRIKLTISYDNDCENGHSTQVIVIFTLTNGYPKIPPSVNLLVDNIDKELIADIERDICEYITLITPEPVLFQAVEYIKQVLHDRVTPICDSVEVRDLQCISKPENSLVCCSSQAILIKLDHIRNESRYFKNLKSWSMELGANCTVFNCGIHNVYVQLIGETKAMDVFMKRWKSQCIDVDSHGRPCKERLINILAQIPYQEKWSHGFKSVCCQKEDLKSFFIVELRQFVHQS